MASFSTVAMASFSSVVDTKTAGMGAVLALAYGLGRRRGVGEPPQ